MSNKHIHTYSYQDIINARNLSGYEKLILVVLVNAVKAAQQNEQAARNWMRSEECHCYCESLDIDHNILIRWADSGFPKPIKAREMKGVIYR